MKVLVIGCGGIGSAIVKELASRGDQVIATYNTNVSQAIELQKFHGAKIFWCDFSDPMKTDILLASFEDPLEPFEAVVWTAGVVFPGKLEEVSRERALGTFSVNFWGPYFLLRRARKILPQGGKIVLFSSSTSLRASPGLAAYAASKAALNSLALSAAEELIEYGIRIYNLCPGRVATPLRRKIAPEEDQSKIMQPEQVAKVVAFILSEAGDALSTFPVRIHMGPYV